VRGVYQTGQGDAMVKLKLGDHKGQPAAGNVGALVRPSLTGERGRRAAFQIVNGSMIISSFKHTLKISTQD